MQVEVDSTLCKWFLAGMSDFRENSAGYLANHMARLFAAGLQHRVRPLGIAPAQFMVMLELCDQDGLTQRQLAQRLDVEQATMANTLRRMERDGLIVRRPSQTDKRARDIFLTGKARALQDAAIAQAQAQNAFALSGLDDTARAQFLETMRKVIATMQRGQ